MCSNQRWPSALLCSPPSLSAFILSSPARILRLDSGAVSARSDQTAPPPLPLPVGLSQATGPPPDRSTASWTISVWIQCSLGVRPISGVAFSFADRSALLRRLTLSSPVAGIAVVPPFPAPRPVLSLSHPFQPCGRHCRRPTISFPAPWPALPSSHPFRSRGRRCHCATLSGLVAGIVVVPPFSAPRPALSPSQLGYSSLIAVYACQVRRIIIPKVSIEVFPSHVSCVV